MTQPFDSPTKNSDGTWTTPVLGKLLKESQAASAENPVSFLAAIGWLTLLKLLEHSFVPQDPNVKISTLFDGQPLGRLHASLIGDFKPPAGILLDDNGPLLEEVVDPFAAPTQDSEGNDTTPKVTKVNLLALQTHVETLCQSAQKLLNAGMLAVADGVKLELKAK